MPLPLPIPPADVGGVDVAAGDATRDPPGDPMPTGEGASYDWGGFSEGSTASVSQIPLDDAGGESGDDWGGFEEFDDFGADGSSSEGSSGGLFDILKDLVSDD